MKLESQKDSSMEVRELKCREWDGQSYGVTYAPTLGLE